MSLNHSAAEKVVCTHFGYKPLFANGQIHIVPYAKIKQKSK